MRHSLIPAAILTVLATAILALPALAQHGHLIGADARNAPAAAPPGQPPHQGGGNGGPTSFTNKPPQGTLPGENGGRANRGDRGNRAASPGQPQTAAPQGRGDRDRGDYRRGGNRDYRGNDQNYRGDNRYGNRGYNSRRHDFSNFRDYHRNFRASRRFRGPDYRRPSGWYDHRWTFGEFLPSAFWARDYWLSDFGAYDLPPPPYGAIWVRVGNDALLVDQDSGEVITVQYDVFY